MRKSTIENVLGTIGTLLWSGQIIPQIWKSWRTKSTVGLSAMLMFLWATSALFLGIYNIVQHINIPLMVQPQLFGSLAAISWCQCLYYNGRLPKHLCYLVLLAYLCLFAGFETGMTYALRALLSPPLYSKGLSSYVLPLFVLRQASKSSHTSGHHLLQFFGILCAVLISAGLIPQYVEIWRLGEVRGISMTFMAVDILGGVFSLLSLVFRTHFDVTASVSYIAVIVLDGVVVLCRIILNPRAAKRRQGAGSGELDTCKSSIERQSKADTPANVNAETRG